MRLQAYAVPTLLPKATTCPILQFDPDTNGPELEQNPQVKGLVPQDGFHFRLRPQVSARCPQATHTSVQLTAHSGFPPTIPPRFDNLLEQLRTQERLHSLIQFIIKDTKEQPEDEECMTRSGGGRRVPMAPL